MKKLLSTLNPVTISRKAHAYCVASLMTVGSAGASAGATNLGAVGTTSGANATGLTTGLLQLSGLFGFGLVAFGLVKIRSAKQQGESPANAVGMLAIGACLLSIPVIAAIFSTSMFGADQTATIKGQINP